MFKGRRQRKVFSKDNQVKNKISFWVQLLRLRRSKFFWVYLLLSFLVILGGIAGVVQLEKIRISAASDRGHAFQMMSEIKQVIEDENIIRMEERLKGAFTEKQLVAMIEQFVEYELYVNNQKIGENQTIFYSKTPSIRITFYERFDKEALKLFSSSTLMDTSKIRKEFLDKNIIISTTASEYGEYKIEQTPQGIRTDINFTGVKAGEIISLDVNYQFAKLIKLEDARLEIFYNITTGGGGEIYD